LLLELRRLKAELKWVMLERNNLQPCSLLGSQRTIRVHKFSPCSVSFSSSGTRAVLFPTTERPMMTCNLQEEAVVECFYQLLKRERVKKRIHGDRAEAKYDVFDYIELFYNPTRRHGDNRNLLSMDYEENYFNELRSV